MSTEISEVKLKALIQICKETKNNKKLAVVSFILSSNKLDETGITLGFRKRNKNAGETIYDYMTTINQIFQKNLQLSIFTDVQIEVIRECEPIFLMSKGDIAIQYIKKMFTLYFELCKLKVPNLHKEIPHEGLTGSRSLNYLSFFSSNNGRRKKDSNTLTPLLLQQIKYLERKNQEELKNKFDPEKFEKSIHLHAIKTTIEQKGRRGIHIQGPLKHNISYQMAIESIYTYFLIGLIFLTISLGIIILLELSYFPNQLGNLSNWSIIIFGVSGLLIFLYIIQFRKEVR